MGDECSGSRRPSQQAQVKGKELVDEAKRQWDRSGVGQRSNETPGRTGDTFGRTGDTLGRTAETAGRTSDTIGRTTETTRRTSEGGPTTKS